MRGWNLTNIVLAHFHVVRWFSSSAFTITHAKYLSYEILHQENFLTLRSELFKTFNFLTKQYLGSLLVQL